MSKPTVRIAVPQELAELRRKEAEQRAKAAGVDEKKIETSKSSSSDDDLDVGDDKSRRS